MVNLLGSGRPVVRRERACVIRQGRYPFDPRVHREVMALLDAGFEVDVIALRERGRPSRERLEGVRVLRIPLSKNRTGAIRYVLQYLLFILAAGLLAGVLHLRRPYRLVQVHTLPDVLVFAAIIPKLLGARVVLDLHEMFPEFFTTKFGDRPLARRVIVLAEQASIRFADFAITCTNEMREAFVARGADPAKMGVVLNTAEEAVFDVERHPPRGSEDGEFVLICHGTVEPHYGIDTAIEAVALVGDDIPGLRLDVIGSGTYVPEAKCLARARGVEDRVRFSEGWVPIDDLLEAISRADAGVVAMKRDAFRDLTHCNKMYDLVTMRRPVITSRTRSVQAYFDDDCFEYFDSGDPADLARAMRRMHDDPDRRERLVARATNALEPYRWPRQRAVYLSYIDRVLGERRGDAGGAAGAS
jgi:glycosyltransferase involved in cell wall biosynthesis